MAGFQLSLKKRKVERAPLKLSKGFNSKSDGESDLESKVIEISLFDGSSASINTERKPPLIIEQPKLMKLIPKQPSAVSQHASMPTLKHGLNIIDSETNVAPETDPYPELLSEDKVRRSILAGEHPQSDTDLVISARSGDADKDLSDEDDDEDQYSRVPVDQFGAAMLRGMGWKPLLKDTVKSVLVEKRQRGPLLGIGAKGVEVDVMSELNGPRGAKLTIPMLRINRATGEIIRDESPDTKSHPQ